MAYFRCFLKKKLNKVWVDQARTMDLFLLLILAILKSPKNPFLFFFFRGRGKEWKLTNLVKSLLMKIKSVEIVVNVYHTDKKMETISLPLYSNLPSLILTNLTQIIRQELLRDKFTSFRMSKTHFTSQTNTQ